MVTFIVVLVGLFAADQFQPYVARVYGVGHFPWENRDQVRRLHKHYGLVRLPRSAFVLAAPFAIYGYQHQSFGLSQDIWTVLMCLVFLAWMILSLIDTRRARNFAVGDDPVS